MLSSAMRMAEAVLRIEHLQAGFVPGSPVVNGVSLELRAGEIVALFGPNGAGKSTLVRAIAGIVQTFAGRARCNGGDITGLPSWEIARAGVGYVAQRANVFTEMTVAENLALGRPARRGAPAMTPAEVLALFPELAERRAARVGALSGGQRQMVAIGRVLLSGPQVLLLDEPSAGLAPKLVSTLFATLSKLKARVPMLVVEQNVKAALAIADRALLLAEGRLVHEGTPDALLADPAVAAAFLGAATS
jgi:branched-chain amino acid transport system ATP-binding protein